MEAESGKGDAMPRPRSSRLRSASGIELCCWDWGGAGPSVLLHHANGFCSGVWRPVARELAGECRLLALDARGHGASDAPAATAANYDWNELAGDLVDAARQLVQRCGTEAIDLAVGHSFGGALTLAAAARAPELFRNLLAIDPVLIPRVVDPARMLGNPLATAARRRQSRFPSRAAAREAWRRKDFFADWDEEAFEGYLDCGLRECADGNIALACAPEVEAALFESAHSLDLQAVASQVRAPALLLWAERGSFSLDFYRQMAACMSQARVETIAAGHLVPMEQPQLVVAHIRALLAGR